MLHKLVGYKRFASKKNGQQYCVAFVVSDLLPSDKAAGFVGQKVEEVFMPEELVNMLKPEHVGHEIVLTHQISGTRAYLTDVTVK